MIRDHVSSPGVGSTLYVEVKNPRTHIENGKALYTDYEIEVQTNHPSFPLLSSKTRRRYSEFVWLRNQLGFNDVMLVTVPRLPRKQLIGRFKESFLQERSEGLERFLKRVVAETSYLQEPSLQLFLQTNLTMPEMDHYLKTRTTGAIRSLIMKLHTRGLKGRERKISAQQPSNEYPLTKKNWRRHQIGGRGWSSQYGDGYYSFSFGDEDKSIFCEKDVRLRSSTVNAGALPGGKLTLPTIPGSMDDGLPCSGSEFTTTEDEEEIDLRPLSASWHGAQHDQIDFILDDYDVIPIGIIAEIEEKHQAEISNLGYLDLTTTTDPLNDSYSNEQACFDF